MRPGGRRKRRTSGGIGGRRAALATAALALVLLWPGGRDAPRAEQAAGPCAGIDARSAAFLACVVATLKAEESTHPADNPVLGEPVAGYLAALEGAIGYQGSASDLDALRRRSSDLKRDPQANRAAIAALDSAVASHASELRTVLDARTYAAQASPGTDVYPVFVREALAFLESDRAKFYERGPFEEFVVAQLAALLESAYFLEKAAGRADEGKLNRELAVLDQDLRILTLPDHDYILAPEAGGGANGTRFWRASLLFLLERTSESRAILRDLAIGNQSFGLYTADIDHIFVGSPFALPYEMIVRGARDKDGLPVIDIKNPAAVERNFNPAQLALVACAHLDDKGPDRIKTFMRAVADTVLSDYYVVAASADSAAKLQKLDAAMSQVINGEKLGKERAALVQTIEAKDEGFSREIERGARACGVADAVRDKIYWKFRFQSQIESQSTGKKAAKYRGQLLFGGRLNASQARAVSDFINKSVLRELAARREELGIEDAASVARMRIGR
jgi:hypothetical protein